MVCLRCLVFGLKVRLWVRKRLFSIIRLSVCKERRGCSEESLSCVRVSFEYFSWLGGFGSRGVYVRGCC